MIRSRVTKLAFLTLWLLLSACSSSGSDDSGGTSGGSSGESAANRADNSEVTEVAEPSRLGAPVVSFRAQSQSTRSQHDVPVTWGQVFAQGDVPSGRTVAAAIDGERIPTQVDEKATWPDGSLRHAVITARVDSLDAGTRTLIQLHQAGKNAASAPVSLDELLASSFSADVRLRVDNNAYVARARSLLSAAGQRGACTEWASACKRWLSGPLVSEWIVGGPISDGTNTDPHLSTYFHVRAYADASGSVARVRVDAVVENNWAYADKPRNRTYDARIRVGSAQYSIDDLTHYRQARWHKTLWWPGDPQIHARVDTDYLQATRAISRYVTAAPSETFLRSIESGFPPMNNGRQTARMGNAGAQAAIGPLPRWTASYAISGDVRAFAWMLANDDAVGSYGFHYRDQETGRPLEITHHPYVTIADRGHYREDQLPRCRQRCGSPYAFDIAHHPSIGYVPYLVTGDFYYLEEMQFTASYIELWANPKYRGYKKGLLNQAQGQVRGQAWSLRSIADAAFATPDDDPLKPYFETLTVNILDDYLNEFVDNDAQNPLHVLDDYGAVIYPLNGRKRVGIGPWQADFFVWSVGHARELGVPGAGRFLEWLALFPIQRMTSWISDRDENFCWLQASAYKLQIRATRGSPMYDTIDDVYRVTFPDLYGLDCNSPEMVNVMSSASHEHEIDEMVGYAHSPHGFVANMQIGLAMAVDSGIAGAADAWRVFAGRTPKPDYGNYPNFGVVPRNQENH